MSRTAVIILNWNGRDLLRRYLPSVVKNTTATGAEVIVADNASSDDSIDVLRTEFPDVRLLRFDKNYGFAGGYNKALAAVDHDYVVLLNSDVCTPPNWLEPLVELLDANPDVAACAPKLRDDKKHEFFEYAGAAGGYLDWLCYPFCRGRVMNVVEKDLGQYDDDADALWVSGAALCIRRTLYNEVGGLDEDFFAHMEEIDLCWRLRNKGHRIVATGHSAVFHLGGATLDNTNPQKTYLNFRNNLFMLIKNYNTRTWHLVLLLRLVLDGAAGAQYLLKGQWQFCKAIIRAHFSLYASLRKTLNKRAELKKGRSRNLVPEVRPYAMPWANIFHHANTFSQLENRIKK